MKRVIFYVIVTCVLIAAPLHAQRVLAPAVTATSEYSWRGLILAETPALLPELSLSTERWEVGITTTMSTGATRRTLVDATAWAQSNLELAGMGLSAGLLTYLDGHGKYDSTELLIGVGWRSLGVTSYTDLGSIGGTYFELTASHEVPKLPLTAALNAGASFGQNGADEYFVRNGFTYVDAALDYARDAGGVTIDLALHNELKLDPATRVSGERSIGRYRPRLELQLLRKR